MLLYAVTGMLNIDDLIANRAAIEGPVGFAALILVLACLLLLAAAISGERLGARCL